MVPTGNNDFQLRARHSNKCLDVYEYRHNNGAPVVQWECLGNAQLGTALRPRATRSPSSLPCAVRAANVANSLPHTAISSRRGLERHRLPGLPRGRRGYLDAHLADRGVQRLLRHPVGHLRDEIEQLLLTEVTDRNMKGRAVAELTDKDGADPNAPSPVGPRSPIATISIGFVIIAAIADVSQLVGFFVPSGPAALLWSAAIAGAGAALLGGCTVLWYHADLRRRIGVIGRRPLTLATAIILIIAASAAGVTAGLLINGPGPKAPSDPRLSSPGSAPGSPSPSAPSTTPSIEQAQAFFASAEKFDQEGRTKEAQAATVEAVRLYGQLIKLNPHLNGQRLAPAIIQALGRAGIDFSVGETALRSYLANPTDTPYPAISQLLLLQGWRLKTPVYLDVIVDNYGLSPGITPPRDVADVKPDVLKAAILDGSNTRRGTQVTDFQQLLKP